MIIQEAATEVSNNQEILKQVTLIFTFVKVSGGVLAGILGTLYLLARWSWKQDKKHDDSAPKCRRDRLRETSSEL